MQSIQIQQLRVISSVRITYTECKVILSSLGPIKVI